MNVSVRAGAQSPERLRVTVENAALEPNPLDLTLVTAVSITATRPDGRRENWAMTITDQATDSLVVERVWLINDVFAAGLYSIDVIMTVPAGIRRAGPTVLEVT